MTRRKKLGCCQEEKMKKQTPFHRRWFFVSVWFLLLCTFLMSCAALEEAQQRREARYKQRALEQQASQKPQEQNREASQLVGQPAPDFTLYDLNGNEVRLSDFRGKPVVLNFWATWCGPCRVEIPHVNVLYDKYKAQGLVVIGVNDEPDHATVRSFAEQHISYTVALDGSTQFRQYGVRGMPATFYIDREGIVRSYDLGFGLDGPTTIDMKTRNLL
jgi:peroxiredoxin